MLTRFLYRIFRITQLWILRHRPPVLTYLYFAALTQVEIFLAWRHERRVSPAQQALDRHFYFLKYSRQQPPFILRAETILASTSTDHLVPKGTLYDNSRNPRFNQKLYAMFAERADLAVLDLGCSGGGFVKSILDDGYTAVGLEGSDLSKRLQRAEWATIPLHLFTCDITKHFAIETPNSERCLFDAITAWEVLEHIPRELVPPLIRNIHDNLKPSGLFFASVNMMPSENPNLNAVYHKTLADQAWWTDQFVRLGFTAVLDHGFQTEDWVRGHGREFDWHPDDGDGFHLVVRKTS